MPSIIDEISPEVGTLAIERERGRRWISAGVIAALVAGILAIGPPAQIKVEGWRLLAVFAGTIAGLMLQPLPGGAVVLLGIIGVILTGSLPIGQALDGYSNPTVWLVLLAFLMARAFIKTGLARRIALHFVRRLGHNSLGLGYALVFSDVLMATIIPANSSRAGGVILPISRSLAELFGSHPGKTAGMLGSFLMLTIYHGDVIAATMFMTGQASNVLVASMAGAIAGVNITWASWLWVASAPALVSLALAPALLYWLNKPSITRTPAAAQFAQEQLAEMGSAKRAEMVLVFIFFCVCGLWMTASWHHMHIAFVPMLGVGALFLTGILTWHDAITESRAWDVFIWYGGLMRMGEALNEYKVTAYFAESIGARMLGWQWPVTLFAVLLIYFYSHYGFASITAHLVAMYPAFLALLVAKGVPAPLAAFSLAYFANLDACLTHYGTTPGPIIFGAGYVDQATWWRIGFYMALLHILVWTVVGFAWWKWLGLW